MADGPWAQYQQTDAKAAPDGPWSQYAGQSAPQMGGNWRLPAMAGSNAVKGAAGTLGMAGDAMRANPENPLFLPFDAIAGATRWGLGKLGLNQPSMVPGQMPTSEDIRAPLKQAGVIDRPDLQPQGEGEQLLAAGSQGVGAALPLGVGGPMSLLRAGISGAGSGVGAYEGNKIGGKTGGIIGGLLGGVGADALTGAAGKVGGAAAGLENEALAPYNRLGIPPRMMGDVTQNPSLQYAQQFAGKMPGGVGATAKAAKASIADFGNAVENSAAKFGPQTTPQEAGQVLQNNARQWINQVLPARNGTAWAPVDQAMAGTTMQLPNYRAALQQIVSSRPGMAATSESLQNPVAAQLLGALDKDVPVGASAPWETVQGIRSDLGDKMGTPEFVQKIGQSNLNRLYGALTQDMGEAADAQNARPYFDQANRISTQNYAIRDNVLSNYVKAKNPVKEDIDADVAAKKALASNGDLQVIRQQMPQAADALAAYEMRRLGMRAGQAGAGGEERSIAAFGTDLNNLRMKRPEGTAALYGKQGAQNLGDLATVAQNSKSAQQFANHSGTAGHNTMSHLATGTLGALLGGHMGAGEMAGAAAGLVALPALNRGLAAALTSPRLGRLIASPNLAPRNVPQGAVPAVSLLAGAGLPSKQQ